jgi:5-formyltetrahydrofolate cyclo-ligase
VLDRIARLGLAPGSTVAGYEPLRTEPGSTELLTELAAAGYRVLVPITLADLDLDWREFGSTSDDGSPDSAEPGSASNSGEPASSPHSDKSGRPPASDMFSQPGALGVQAIGDAAVVLLPAFAVDGAGRRLGRGGGSYDRAVNRIGPTVLTVALLFADELVATLPTDPWDRPVRAAVTPDGWHDLAQLDVGTADDAP